MKKYLVLLIVPLMFIASNALAATYSVVDNANASSCGHSFGGGNWYCNGDFSSLTAGTYYFTSSLSLGDGGYDYGHLYTVNNLGSDNYDIVLTGTPVSYLAFYGVGDVGGTLVDVAGSNGDLVLISCDIGYHISGSSCVLNSGGGTTTTVSLCNSSSTLLNSTGTGSMIQCVNQTWYSYFLVLLAKYWTYLIGVGILLLVWMFARHAISALQ